MPRPLLPTLAAALLAGCTCGTPVEPEIPERPPAPDGAPSVLLVTWHAARADRTSLRDPAKDLTPRLRHLAREALVFDRAVAPAPWALPAAASLATGLPWRAHGVAAPGDVLPEDAVTLAELLHDAGWDTWAWSSAPPVSVETGVLQGFETVEHPWRRPWIEPAERHLRHLGVPERVRVGASDWRFKDAGHLAVQALERWLTTRPDRGRPFLAWVHLDEAQAPRFPTEEALDRVDVTVPPPQRATPFDLLDWTAGDEPAWNRAEDERALYDASIAQYDLHLGALLGATRPFFSDRWVVAVVGDHGEHLGERGTWGHPMSLDPELVRVPFVVAAPHALDHAVSRTPVSTTRLPALLLEVLGAELPRELPAFDPASARAGAVAEHPPLPDPAVTLWRQATLGGMPPELPTAVLERGQHMLRIGPGARRGLFRVNEDDTRAVERDPAERKAALEAWRHWTETWSPGGEGEPTAPEEPVPSEEDGQ